jgi:hypothetical protein
MTRVFLLLLLLGMTASSALAQPPCVPQGPARAALALVRGEQAPVPPLPGHGTVENRAVVGDGAVNTFEPPAAAEPVRAGQLVTVCGEDGSAASLVAEITHATIRVESTACTGATSRTMLEGQVVLRSPEARRLRGAAAGRRPLYAEAAGGWVLAPLTSVEPPADTAQAVAAVARRLGRDDRIVGWGVSNQGGASVVNVLHTARMPARERFAAIDGIPVIWSLLPRGAFDQAGCPAEP